MFRNVHCVGRWIQRNILGLDHTSPFNRPVLQIIHSLMYREHPVCLNTIILQNLVSNSQCTRGEKYSYPILVTGLCRNFLPDEKFLTYDRVFVASERITSAYNSFFHSVWTPTVISEDVPADSSSDKQMGRRTSPSSGANNHPHILIPSCLPFGKA